MSRTTMYTDMGWHEFDALWEYELLTEPLLSSELFRLAGPISTLCNTHAITFQPSPNPDDKNQDRLFLQEWELDNGTWQFRAVFDGHGGHDTVDHVVASLPSMIQVRLNSMVATDPDPDPNNVSEILATAISSLDQQLTKDLLQLFPDSQTISLMSDAKIRSVVNDQDSGGKNAAIVSRCMRGTTVLTALIDPQKRHLWVASLGDSQAVLGLQQADGHWETSILSSFHNGSNIDEQHQIMRDHPNEPECVLNGRVLGAIAVTRAMGDHLFKLPSVYTERVFMNAASGFQISKNIEDFIGRNKTPPYISARADVCHMELGPRKSCLIMCTDGLLDLFQPEGQLKELPLIASQWVQLLAEEDKPRKGNLALALLRHALGGDDIGKVSRMMTVKMIHKWMDDTTIVVQMFG